MHYAIAMFEVAKEEKKLEEYTSELTFVNEVFLASKDLGKFLVSPLVTHEEKEKLLDEHFSKRLSKATLGFLKILSKKGIANYYPQIYLEYKHLYNEENKILEGIIYSAFTLSDKNVEKIKEVFEKKLDRKIVFQVKIDPKVIAGMKIFVADTMYDYSINSKIETIKDKLVYKD
jgi:F-type H+-transporting ATPase subunit delta